MDQRVNSTSSVEVKDQGNEVSALRRTNSFGGSLMLEYNGFWIAESVIQDVISFQRDFISVDNDVLLVTIPKSGTTWLKALVYSILHRDIYTVDQSPLLNSNPHALVPFESQFRRDKSQNPDNGNGLRCLQVYSTHFAYQCLPDSILNSKCKIIYLCRNPLDQFISLWHFTAKLKKASEKHKVLPIDEAFELFLEGKHWSGPFWEHILGYWNARLKDPEKVLFLKYEDLKKDVVPQVKMIAEFLGLPFTEDEEENGLIEDIIKLCSFESLTNLEVNKTGTTDFEVTAENKLFFRKGEVGDWANYLTPAMAARAQRLMEEKFAGSGFTFEPNIDNNVC